MTDEEYSPELLRAVLSLASQSETPAVKTALDALVVSVTIDEESCLQKTIKQERHQFFRYYRPMKNDFKGIEFFSVRQHYHLTQNNYWFRYYIRIVWNDTDADLIEQQLLAECKWSSSTFFDRVSDLFEILNNKNGNAYHISIDDLNYCYTLKFKGDAKENIFELTMTKRPHFGVIEKDLAMFKFTAEEYQNLIDIFPSCIVVSDHEIF